MFKCFTTSRCSNLYNAYRNLVLIHLCCLCEFRTVTFFHHPYNSDNYLPIQLIWWQFWGEKKTIFIRCMLIIHFISKYTQYVFILLSAFLDNMAAQRTTDKNNLSVPVVSSISYTVKWKLRFKMYRLPVGLYCRTLWSDPTPDTPNRLFRNNKQPLRVGKIWNVRDSKNRISRTARNHQ